MGHVILVGRGSAQITARMENVLHIRLVAPLDTRVQHIARFHDLSAEQALGYIHKTDRARRRYVQRYFDAAIDDPLNYDMILNTGRVSFQTAARLIAEAVFAMEKNHAAL
jgi:cytidylate kinase